MGSIKDRTLNKERTLAFYLSKEVIAALKKDKKETGCAKSVRVDRVLRKYYGLEDESE